MWTEPSPWGAEQEQNGVLDKLRKESYLHPELPSNLLLVSKFIESSLLLNPCAVLVNSVPAAQHLSLN